NCELSLKRLQTDHLDVLHIHGLKYVEDLDVLENEGTVKALYRLRDQKMVRLIGVTSHADPATLAKAPGKRAVRMTFSAKPYRRSLILEAASRKSPCRSRWARSSELSL